MRFDLCDYAFDLVGDIEPERQPDGTIRQFMPQSRYANHAGLPLNRHGAGPFCRFRIAGEVQRSGVYLLTVESEVVYIGECVSLAARFGPNGYGGISPRNCYQGGQVTNCRINHLILGMLKAGRRVRLWFLQVADRKGVEAELIRRVDPQWNAQTPSAHRQ